MQRLAASLLVPLCLAAAPPGDEEDGLVAVSGRILNAEGAPVADATASMWWSMTGGTPTAFEGLTADADGAFAGELQIWNFPAHLGAYSPDGSLSGITVLEEDALGGIELVLRPSVRVHGRVTRSELDRPLDSAQVSLSVDDGFGIDVQADAGPLNDDLRFEALLPRGELSWMIYDSYFSMVTGERALGSDARDVDLGTFDIPAAFLARYEGKVLPEWTVSDARNVPLDQATLAAHRGKWLLIEFWGFW